MYSHGQLKNLEASVQIGLYIKIYKRPRIDCNRRK